MQCKNCSQLAANTLQKTDVQTFQASFATGTLTKMPLRSNAWTAFAFWSTAGGRAKGFSRKATEGISNSHRYLAKRHFGQQASERLKPKCP
jgi:hypothetical protein